MHRLSFVSGVLAISVVAAPAAAAVPFTSRSASTALVAHCPSGPLGQPCDSGYVLGSGNFNGYTGVEDYKPTQFGLGAASFARLTPPGDPFSYGSAISYVLDDPASDLPVLKVGAFTRATDLGRYATSFAFVSTLAAYTNTGSVALPLSLVGDVDFTMTFAPINMGAPFASGSLPYSFAQLRGRLVIGTPDLYQGVTLQPQTLLCGTPGVLASAANSAFYSGFNQGWGGTTQSLGFSMDVSQGCAGGGPVVIQPGDSFYIYAYLDALGLQGGTVDATNSLNINFTPDTPPSVIEAFAAGASPVGVPEPDSWALLIAGFGLTGAVMRRRRVVSAA